jgi:HK97 family phage major capsid protein
VWSQRENEIIYEPGQRAFNVMALMAKSPCSSNLIEYFREDVLTGGGPGSQDHETHVKNQLGVTFAKVSRPIETIAGWIPISRQVLDDAPQLQSYIDGRLMYAVNAVAEYQVLFGDGANGELLGIMNTPNVQTLGAPTGTDTNLDQIRRAIAMVRDQEYAATGIVLNPMDYCEIELLKDGDLRYIWVNVNDNGAMRLWRLPVALLPLVPTWAKPNSRPPTGLLSPCSPFSLAVRSTSPSGQLPRPKLRLTSTRVVAASPAFRMVWQSPATICLPHPSWVFPVSCSPTALTA